MKMKAAVLHQHYEKFQIEEVDICEPRSQEVCVKIVSSGVCHTDYGFRDNFINRPLKMPIILGHEGAGIVTAVGPGVTKFKVGDHVALSTPWCGECEACQKGINWFCERVDEMELEGYDYFYGSPVSKDGKPVWIFFQESCFAEYCVSHVNNVTKLPEDLDLKIAGPLGCGFRTGAGSVYNCLKPRVGEWVAIYGTGNVGLACMWMAKAMGAKTIMIDIRENRLELAKELGADYTVNTKGMSIEESVEAVKEIADGKGPHYVCENTGVTDVAKAAMQAMRRGGKCAQISLLGKAEFESMANEGFDAKDVSYIRMGNVEADVIIPVMAELYKQGRFPFDKLIKFYPFEKINEACDDSESGKVMKPILLFE